MSFQALLDATTPIANGTAQITPQCSCPNELTRVPEQLILFKKKALVESLIRKSLDAQIES